MIIQKIKIVDVSDLKERFKELPFQEMLPNVMEIEILYENEPLLLGFMEDETKNWNLESINFIDKKNVLQEGFVYDVYRKKQLGEKRVEQIKNGIKLQIDDILNHPLIKTFWGE
jgi:hypothetical protein